ncbi:hypothetical protein EVJ58_g5521 [Rhodofomes roseus]|uniref:Threonine/serine exporter-like N-terminal domain-containing protein n=1 Tax=Rhodofomes roseus TaxID=34475 RepID=A0A4Y9YD89_9APHY|nr:hypothetical protein EVJ58_g5521 [Rhodofomes roseus]
MSFSRKPSFSHTSSRPRSVNAVDVWPSTDTRTRSTSLNQDYDFKHTEASVSVPGTSNIDVPGVRSPALTGWRTDSARSIGGPEVPSPPSVYTVDSPTSSCYNTTGASNPHDYFPTPNSRPPSELRRSRSGLVVAEEETASPLSIGADELADDTFIPASASQVSAPLSGPPRPPDTSIQEVDSPASSGTRMGFGRRYDQAPTPGIYLERRRPSRASDERVVGTSHDVVEDDDVNAPRFASDHEDASGLFGDYKFGQSVNDTDYFSFRKGLAAPGSRHLNAPNAHEEVSPKSTPVEGYTPFESYAPQERQRAEGMDQTADTIRTNDSASTTGHRDSTTSSVTLVPPPDEEKPDNGDRKGSRVFWPFGRNQSKDELEGSPPGRSKHAYREKVQKMRNGENVRPGCKRLTTTSIKREKFVMKLAKALLAFGAPSHRIESQLQSASHVLRLDARFVHFPNMIMVTFQSPQGSTNEIHFIRASGRVALTSLHRVHTVYREVLHDRLSTDEGVKKLDEILRAKPHYSIYFRCLLAFICASIICVLAFGGSLLDMFLAGAAASILQLLGLRAAAKSSVYANVYEISVSIIVSFVARGFGTVPNQIFCFSAISSGGVVLVLPGFTVLVSALELTAQNIMCGSVRMVYAVIYTLFLGFGLTIGSELFLVIVPEARKAQDITTLLESHTYHGYLLNNNASIPLAQTSGTWSFTDISQAQSRVIKVGSVVIGVCGNIWSRLGGGTAFTVMVTGVLFLVPSALGNGGGLIGSYNTSSQEYSNSFDLGVRMIEVGIGVTLGLFLAAMLVYSWGGRKSGGHFGF